MKAIWVSFLLLWGNPAFSQIPELEKFPNSDLTYSFGVSSQVFFGPEESNLNLSLVFGFSYKQNAFLIGNQFFLNIYSGGLGTSTLANSILPFYNFSNIFVDFIVSPTATFGIGRLHHPIFIKPINYMSTPVLFHNYAVSGTIGTSFVFNNKRRNQRGGTLNLNFGSLSMGYYNDNMSQIFAANGLGLGDGHDRWWTGSGFASVLLYDYYELMYEFDRFTGFGGKLFEISELLNLNHMFYPATDSINEKDLIDITKNEMFFNRGTTSFGLRKHNYFGNNSFFKFTFMGDPESDVQNLIHRYISKDPFHNTQIKDSWQFSIGGLLKN